MKRALVIGALAAVSLAPSLAADAPNRSVCITADNSSFANNAEGYERKRAAQDLAANPPAIANAIFQVGGNLSDCVAHVASGDQLVLIAHGSAGSFIWNDNTGNDDTVFGDFSQLGLPSGLNNVTVAFVSSQSCSQPAGSGQPSNCSKIIDALNGGRQNTGNTCKGFDNAAVAFSLIDMDSADPGNPANTDEKNAAQRCAALDLFNKDERGTSWANNPPAGRIPEADPNQLSALRQKIAFCPLAHGRVQPLKLILLPAVDISTNLPIRQCAP